MILINMNAHKKKNPFDLGVQIILLCVVWESHQAYREGNN